MMKSTNSDGTIMEFGVGSDVDPTINYTAKMTEAEIERRISEAVAAEREACAQIADDSRFHAGQNCGCGECTAVLIAVDAIRARGK
jgi:hypothetical protein